MTEQVTIKDVSRDPPRIVTGALVKQYKDGLTVDDERGIRHFAFNHNVLTKPQRLQPGDLFASW